MNGYLLLILVVLVAMMLLSNIRKAKSVRKDERYIALYTAVLRNEENAIKDLNEYVETESDGELKNKALIVKIFTDILSNEDPRNTVAEMDLNEVFLTDGAYEAEKVSRNSDSFTWLMLDLAKARSLSMLDVCDSLYEKVSVYDDKLQGHVEYQVFKAAYNAMREKDLSGIDFLNKLLGGEYADYTYDKALIGVFKKFAAALLVYTGEPIAEEDESILYDFALTQVGNRFMSDLDIVEKYMVKEEPKEIVSEEKVDETIEAMKEKVDNAQDRIEETIEETEKDELKEKVEELKKNLEE